MNAMFHLRRSIGPLGAALGTAVALLAVQAAAQMPLSRPSLSFPPAIQKGASDIQVDKAIVEGRFEITVGNHGSSDVSGIVVTDKAADGVLCPETNEVTITGSAVPAGNFTVADLRGAGITLGTLSGDQVSILSYSCGGN